MYDNRISPLKPTATKVLQCRNYTQTFRTPSLLIPRSFLRSRLRLNTSVFVIGGPFSWRVFFLSNLVLVPLISFLRVSWLYRIALILMRESIIVKSLRSGQTRCKSSATKDAVQYIFRRLLSMVSCFFCCIFDIQIYGSSKRRR
ncbi:hypothetical protein IWZ01DRAFT_494704 [Phyllosticta capitalensis]